MNCIGAPFEEFLILLATHRPPRPLLSTALKSKTSATQHIFLVSEWWRNK